MKAIFAILVAVFLFGCASTSPKVYKLSTWHIVKSTDDKILTARSELWAGMTVEQRENLISKDKDLRRVYLQYLLSKDFFDGVGGVE